MASRDEEIEDIIDNYMAPDGHPAMAERVHRYVFDEPVEFHSWDEVKSEYIGKEWSQEIFDRFIQKCQQVVEGGEKRIPESYFDITEPSTIGVDEIINDLEERPFNGNERGKEREGFKYTVTDDRTVRATYVFVNEKKDLTASGDVDTLVSERSVSYRILPSESLLVVESTYPPDVQRTKKIFRKYTSMSITVLGSIPANYSNAEQNVEKFLSKFDRRDLEGESE